MSGALAGRRALVTGASRGIGWAVARALAAAGARLALVARRADVLARHAASLGGGALALTADVTDPDQVAHAMTEARDAFGDAPDILVHAAGIFHPVRLDLLSVAEFDATIDANLRSAFLVTRAVLPRLRERGSGHVVFIGSVADRTIFAENGAYAASKFGLRALTEVLRAETRGTGVRVSIVSPGPTDTPIWDAIDTAARPGRFPPRERMLGAADVAAAVCYVVTQPPGVNVDELRLAPA